MPASTPHRDQQPSSSTTQSTGSAPSVSSTWGSPEDGEIALTDAHGRTRHLSRPDALRLAARLKSVAQQNRALDRKLADFHEHYK